MNRMHPQDLRAIVAAIYHAVVPDIPACVGIDLSDRLMAQLERTAKPEPEKHWSYWQKRCDKAEAALADAAKSERERIIAILVEEAPAYSERYFRAITEPKP